MMTESRGRGFALRGLNDTSQREALRRPGTAGLVQRFGNVSEPEIAVDVEVVVNEICGNISQLDLKDSKSDLSSFSLRVKSICQNVQDLEKSVDTIFTFALKTKWNAHISAILCDELGDIIIGGVKFRTHLLRKLQSLYIDRKKKYLELEKFLMDVTFLCEIFHHMLIDGACLKVLTHPIIDYFGMLIDGASQKEIEVFVEQFPKCYKNLKENNPSGLDILLSKLRKQIVCETSTIITKAMLLEMFELALTDWKPLNQNAENLYGSLTKPILRICE